MEENNKIKIRFSTVILTIIIVIITIISIIFFIQKISSDTQLEEANNEISKLKLNNSDKDKTINNLQSKIENIMNQIAKNETQTPELNIQSPTDNNINSTNTFSNTTIDNNKTNNSKNITEQEALTIGKEKYKKAINSHWDVPVVKSNNKYNIGDSDEIYYKVTDMTSLKALYSKNGLKQFLDYHKEMLIEISDEYYISESWMNRGSNIFYKENELEVTNISENKIEFISNEKYSQDMDEQGDTNSGDIIKKYKFNLVKEDGIWKIDEFTLPN